MKLPVRIGIIGKSFLRSLKSHQPSQMTIPKKIVVVKGKIPIVVLSNKKTKHCVWLEHPRSFQQFCKARFPLGGFAGSSLLLYPSIDMLGAPGEDKPTQIFVTLKVHLRHLCPRWVIILGSNHILQNENNKETFDQKLGRRWAKRQAGWQTVNALKGAAAGVSGALRNKLPPAV